MRRRVSAHRPERPDGHLRDRSTATAAGVLAREMLSQIDPPWEGTTYGADLGTLVNRIVARGGPGSVGIDLLARLAEAIDVVDAWEDFALVRAGTTHLLDDTLTEDDFVRGWTPRWIVEHFRTRTIARGGGISGGVTFFEFTGDGSTDSWALPYPVREVISLTVDGVLQTFGTGSGEWEIVDKIELRAPAAPANGEAGKLEFDIEAPLIAIAEDAVTAAAIGGHIVRSVEDSSIDSLETLEELARTTQARHGAMGFEIAGDLIPLKRPRFLGVGGSPRVEVRGYTGRMTIQRLRSTWLGGGEYVQQHVTLRVNDLAAGLDYQRRRQILALPTLPERPVLPLPHAGITVGQKLPHTLGGVWNELPQLDYMGADRGHVEYTIDWNIYDGFVLAISFMADARRRHPARRSGRRRRASGCATSPAP